MAWVLFGLIDGLIEFYLKPLAARSKSQLDDQLLPVIRKVSKIGVVLIVVIMVLDSWDVDVTAALAGLGIGGLAFAIAAQSTVADIFGGVSIFTSRPFLVGDFIKFEEIKGNVEEIGLRHTRVRTLLGTKVTIPNKRIADAVVENYSNNPKRMIELNLGLVYDTRAKQLREAKKIVEEILASHEHIQKNPPPVIVFKEFQDFSLNLFVRYYLTDPSKYWETRDIVNFAIKERFEKAGLEFAFPTQTVYVQGQNS
jgi:MscS family membrane protein